MRDIQKVLAALTSPVRREILGLIWDRELSAGEIAAAFPVTKPTISQHLAVLREAGLAESTAVGTSRRYRARRDALRGLRAAGALGSAARWTNADDAPERAASNVRTSSAVIASTDVDTSQALTFTAFTDAVVYSRWLGVPVTLQDGRFACTMEWGTNVRGRYELVCPPELIVMRWDFDDDNVPVPGGEMTGYLRIQPHGPEPTSRCTSWSRHPLRPRSWRARGPRSSAVSRPASPAPATPPSPCPRANPAPTHPRPRRTPG